MSTSIGNLIEVSIDHPIKYPKVADGGQLLPAETAVPLENDSQLVESCLCLRSILLLHLLSAYPPS